MRIDKKDDTGFSVIHLAEEDLKNLPPVILPRPELPQPLVEKIKSALSKLRESRPVVARAG
jgi:hypothetical protein